MKLAKKNGKLNEIEFKPRLIGKSLLIFKFYQHLHTIGCHVRLQS